MGITTIGDSRGKLIKPYPHANHRLPKYRQNSNILYAKKGTFKFSPKPIFKKKVYSGKKCKNYVKFIRIYRKQHLKSKNKANSRLRGREMRSVDTK